jgi:hypothetical protein
MKKWMNNKNIAFWVRASLSVFLFVTIGVYTFVQMREIFYGVNIKANINTYSENTGVSQISGFAKNAVHFAINGREIYIDKDGSFTDSVALPSGFSIITLTATDQFGKMKEKTMQVYTVNNKSVAYQVTNTNL